jgi:hypothetical protein
MTIADRIATLERLERQDLPELGLKTLARAHPCPWVFCRMRFINWTTNSLNLINLLGKTSRYPIPCPQLFCQMVANQIRAKGIFNA